MGVRSTGTHPTTTSADGHLLEYFRQTFGGGGGAALPPPPPFDDGGMVASGGVISEYTDPGPGYHYRAHTFTSAGTFDVSELSTQVPNNVDVLVVGGGGAGGSSGPGSYETGGGGAGGFRTQTNIPVTAISHSIVIGAGGVGGYEELLDFLLLETIVFLDTQLHP